MSVRFQLLFILSSTLLLAACAGPVSGTKPRGTPSPDLPIDLGRFMGDWFVIAHMPLSAEQNAYQAVESYTLRKDGDIDVLFRFCEGALDGPEKRFTMRGWVHDRGTNAEWRVRPFWPLALRYQILQLDPDYTLTVVGHPSGNYAWIMAREPRLAESTLAEITSWLGELGYQTERMRRVPHSEGGCEVPPEDS